jgi:hypothetical protein
VQRSLEAGGVLICAGFKVGWFLDPKTCRLTRGLGGHRGRKLANSSVSGEDNSGLGGTARKLYGRKKNFERERD